MNAAVAALAGVLIAHDADRMSCSDHDKLCCPTPGCAHDFDSPAAHQAEMVLRHLAAMQQHPSRSPEPCTCGLRDGLHYVGDHK